MILRFWFTFVRWIETYGNAADTPNREALRRLAFRRPDFSFKCVKVIRWETQFGARAR